MNKDVIKKYKEAFDWWLDGGEILVNNSGSNPPYWLPIEQIEPAWGSEEDTYIINDEYVEFRKALAEGKTVQYRYRIKDNKSDWCEWTSQTKFCESLDMYRIKPDEPKFKIGDWVRCKNVGMVKFGEGDMEYYNDLSEANKKLYELWEPKEGDVVVFSLPKWKHSAIGKAELILDGQLSVGGWFIKEFKNCIPYVGQDFEQIVSSI